MLSEIEPSHCRYNNALTIAHPKDPQVNGAVAQPPPYQANPKTPRTNERERERERDCENYVYGASRGEKLGGFVVRAQSTSSSSLPRAYQNLLKRVPFAPPFPPFNFLHSLTAHGIGEPDTYIHTSFTTRAHVSEWTTGTVLCCGNEGKGAKLRSKFCDASHVTMA